MIFSWSEDRSLQGIKSEELYRQYLPIWGEQLEARKDHRAFSFSRTQLIEIIALYQTHHFPELNVHHFTELPRAQSEAIGSEWSRGLFFYACMPLLTMTILSNHLPTVSWDKLSFFMDSSMTVKGCAIEDLPINYLDEALNSPQQDIIQLLVDAYLFPMIQMIHQETKCGAKILWANLIGYWRWWVTSDEWSTIINLFPENLREAILSRKHRAACLIEQKFIENSNQSNPLYHPMKIRMIDGLRVELRRTCCQRHRLPNLEYCSYCPFQYSEKR